MKNKELIQELKEIKSEIHTIKVNMVDKDMVLSQDDFESLAETTKEKKAGKLISLDKIEKELGCS
ncbi:hypothetical protein KY361_03275 [Candidatus Woesearchaeota archaeon]|nr:hypothetical protein [Candidatus Woesearchaeota archaeon]